MCPRDGAGDPLGAEPEVSPWRPASLSSRRRIPTAARPPPSAGDIESADVHAGDGSRDHQLLDLLGSLEQVVDLGVAVPALDGEVADVAVAAEDLDRPDRKSGV